MAVFQWWSSSGRGSLLIAVIVTGSKYGYIPKISFLAYLDVIHVKKIKKVSPIWYSILSEKVES